MSATLGRSAAVCSVQAWFERGGRHGVLARTESTQRLVAHGAGPFLIADRDERLVGERGR
jgi:hypothetical protein